MLPVEKYRKPTAGAVLAALHEINERCGYLTQDELRQSATELGIPLSTMYGAASFYASFSFKPCGRHRVQVCEGTACYVKGATALLDYLSTALGIAPDESTDDLLFQLKRVRCVGSCGLAPVVRVDEQTFGRVDASSLDSVLAQFQDADRKGR
ncbi:MAG: NAD(P)H-dependent oxidoreductase subunit E [Anaerolineales bacterium]